LQRSEEEAGLLTQPRQPRQQQWHQQQEGQKKKKKKKKKKEKGVQLRLTLTSQQVCA